MNPWDDLSWEDIDWNILKKGMLVTPNEAFSFSRYLNVFLWAGQEKYKMVLGELADFVIDKFEPSDIMLPRAFGADVTSNQHFAGQLRNLIKLYKGIFDARDWYEDYALDVPEGEWDPDFLSDYKVFPDDQAVIDVMGEEAYNIFMNYGQMTFFEIFKASLFRGLYELYKKLNIYYSAVDRFQRPRDEPIAANPTVVVSNTTYMNDYLSAYGTEYETAFAEFQSSITGPVSENTTVSYPSGRRYHGRAYPFMSFRAKVSFSRNGEQWDIRLTSTRDMRIELNQKNLDDDMLTIDVSNIIIDAGTNTVGFDTEYTDIIDYKPFFFGATRKVVSPQKSDNNSITVSMGDLYFKDLRSNDDTSFGNDAFLEPVGIFVSVKNDNLQFSED